SPVGQIEYRIVTAGDPHFSTGAIPIWESSPCFGACIAARSNGVKTPELFARLGIVSTQEAFFFLISTAAPESFNDFSISDNWAAGVAVTLSDFRIPNQFAVPGVQRFNSISAGQIDLVLVNRE